MKELWQLFFSFMRIGGLTFGGGLSMLPMLKYELVEKKGWITEDTLLDCYAVGQCTPGIIAVNTATFVGYKRKGVLGAIFATLGMMVPSVVIITIVAISLEQFVNNAMLQHALTGIKAAVCALLFQTVLGLVNKSVIGIVSGIICLLVTALAIFTKIPTIYFVLVSGILGVLLKSIEERIKKGE